jgi:hypothetical protein
VGPILIENKILDPINALHSVLLLIYAEVVNEMMVRYNVRGVMMDVVVDL